MLPYQYDGTGIEANFTSFTILESKATSVSHQRYYVDLEFISLYDKYPSVDAFIFRDFQFIFETLRVEPTSVLLSSEPFVKSTSIYCIEENCIQFLFNLFLKLYELSLLLSY